MGRSLGIRAVPEGFFWAVVEGERAAPILVANDRAVFPASYAEPASLSWCRDRLHHLIDSYNPRCVAVRLPEAYARAASTDSARRRNRAEGVLIEAANAKALRVHMAAMAT